MFSHHQQQSRFPQKTSLNFLNSLFIFITNSIINFSASDLAIKYFLLYVNFLLLAIRFYESSFEKGKFRMEKWRLNKNVPFFPFFNKDFPRFVRKWLFRLKQQTLKYFSVLSIFFDTEYQPIIESIKVPLNFHQI